MRQLRQRVKDGELRLAELPRPSITATQVLVAPLFSVVSPGTERAAQQRAEMNVLAKARARPELVRQVITRVRSQGIRSTAQAVQDRLNDERCPGYSAAGRVVEVGESVTDVRPDQLVATGGAGHSELQVVSGQLVAPVPDGVAAEDACFATVGSIALHALHNAEASLGSSVCILGMGLIGQLAARLALAHGARVSAIDLDHAMLEYGPAEIAGFEEAGDSTTRRVLDWSGGTGVDAVLVCASTTSPVAARRAVELLRDRGSLVIVGDVPLDLDRDELYRREVRVQVSRSYGPGRYVDSYENWGVDFPVGAVRWTEQRNMGAVLDCMRAGTLRPSEVVTHRYDFDDAVAAYRVLADPDVRSLGMLLEYRRSDKIARPVRKAVAPRPGSVADGPLGVALLGGGAFSQSVVVPVLRATGCKTRVVVSARGASAEKLVRRGAADEAASSAEEAVNRADVALVYIASPHSEHATHLISALDARKHVFCEKPLALSTDELARVIEAWERSPGELAVGFNRRFAPMSRHVFDMLAAEVGPVTISYVVNAGPVPEGHWYRDRRQGGRLLGEGCHFIDWCIAAVDTKVRSVQATGNGSAEVVLPDDYAVTLSFVDGSIATICSATRGSSRVPKERIEVSRGGRTAIVEDFGRLWIDGTKVKAEGGKGHQESFEHFLRLLGDGSSENRTVADLITTASTLAAADALRSGASVRPPDLGG